MQECADSPPAHAPTCTLAALAGSNAGHGSPLCALTTFSRLAVKAACASLCCCCDAVRSAGSGARGGRQGNAVQSAAGVGMGSYNALLSGQEMPGACYWLMQAAWHGHSSRRCTAVSTSTPTADKPSGLQPGCYCHANTPTPCMSVHATITQPRSCTAAAYAPALEGATGVPAVPAAATLTWPRVREPP